LRSIPARQFRTVQELLRDRLRSGFHLLAYARWFRFGSLGLEERMSSQPALNVLLPLTMGSGLVSID
jgi:hypothetical protein